MHDLYERISKYLRLRDAVASEIADKYDIPNVPTKLRLEKIKIVAIKIYDPLVGLLKGREPHISSFFRCNELNEKCGGSNTSQHLKGEAMDLDGGTDDLKNSEIFNAIKDNLEFDQLISEFANDGEPSWVHVSFREKNNRKQILQSRKTKKGVIYEQL